MKTLTSMEAQSRFGQLLDTAQREPATVTRHGRPVAFVVSPQDMQELLDARNERSQAVADLEAWSKQARESLTPAAKDLTQESITRMVHEAR